MREPISKITSRTIVLPMANIDTDQIIPARFLTTTTRDGLGEHAFADWRLDADFPLNDPRAEGCGVLVAGANFGCGSSREHAPWALLDLGIRAVLSPAIADIFRSNALKNGLLPVVTDPETHAWLLANPWSEVAIDLEDCTLSFGAGSTTRFPMDSFARQCLLEGVDELGYLLAKVDAIAAFEAGRP